MEVWVGWLQAVALQSQNLTLRQLHQAVKKQYSQRGLSKLHLLVCHMYVCMRANFQQALHLATNLGGRLVVDVHALQPLQDPTSVEPLMLLLPAAAAHLSELRSRSIWSTGIGV